MSRVSGYNYINVMLQAKGYTKEEAAKAVAEAEADIHSRVTVSKESEKDIITLENYKKSLREAEETEAKINRRSDYYDNESYMERINGISQMDKDLEKCNRIRNKFKEYMDKYLEEAKKRSMDVKKIARKIARGKIPSNKELKFIKENAPLLYNKARAANQARMAKEARLRRMAADELERELLKLSDAVVSNDDLTRVIDDDTKELIKKRLKAKRDREKFEASV